MKIFKSVAELTAAVGQVSLACGNFDGVHCGHQHILTVLKESSKKLGTTPVIFTFDPHPRKVIGSENSSLITATTHKLELFEQYGVGHVVLYNFTRETMNISPEDFINELVNDNVLAVIAGSKWRFGAKGAGTIETLRQQKRCDVIAADEVMGGVEKISSTTIRQHITTGEMRDAKRLLGRYFSLEGKIIQGDQIASKVIGVPTANIEVRGEVLPQNGIYAGLAKLNGITYPGVINVGYSPTFHTDDAPVKVEIHIFDFDQNIYGENLEIKFVEFIRGEEKFDSTESLIKQIFADIEEAKRILEKEKGR